MILLGHTSLSVPVCNCLHDSSITSTAKHAAVGTFKCLCVAAETTALHRLTAKESDSLPSMPKTVQASLTAPLCRYSRDSEVDKAAQACFSWTIQLLLCLCGAA